MNILFLRDDNMDSLKVKVFLKSLLYFSLFLTLILGFALASHFIRVYVVV